MLRVLLEEEEEIGLGVFRGERLGRRRIRVLEKRVRTVLRISDGYNDPVHCISLYLKIEYID